MKIYPTIYFLLISISLLAQTDKTRRLEQEIHYIDSILDAMNYNTEKESLSVYKNLLHHSKSIEYNTGIYDSYLYLIWYYGTNKKMDSVIYFNAKFQELQQKQPNNKKLFVLYMNNSTLFSTIFGLKERAIENLLEAYELKDEMDIASIHNLENNIGLNYINQKKYDLGIEYLQKLRKDSVNMDASQKVVNLSYLALAYQYQKKHEKSGELLDEIEKIANKENNKGWKAYAKLYKTYDYILKKQYKRSLDSGLIARNLIKSHFPRLISTSDLFLAHAHKSLGNYKKAIKYLKHGIKNETLIFEHVRFFDELSLCYKKINKIDSSFYFLEKKVKNMEEKDQAQNQLISDYLTTKLQYIDYNKNLSMIKSSNKFYKKENQIKKKTILIQTFIIIILGLLLLSLVFFLKNVKSRKKIKKLELSEKNLYKKYIADRENQLSNLLLYQSSTVEHIIFLKNNLFKNLRAENWNEVEKGKRELNHYLENIISDNPFADRIESQYIGLIGQLKKIAPELTPAEINHLLLIKLGLSLKESSNILNVTVNTVKTSRYRAKLKLDLNKDDNLRDFLNKIELLDIEKEITPDKV